MTSIRSPVPTALVAVLLSVLATIGGWRDAKSAPVNYTFAGGSSYGEFCTFTGESNNYTCVNQSFSGTLYLDVSPSGPSGSDSIQIDNSYAHDHNGWVLSVFQINTGGSIFTPAPVPYQIEADNTAYVTNLSGDQQGADTLFNRQYFAGANPSDFSGPAISRTYYRSYAYLVRSSTDVSWLSSTTFLNPYGLAPFGGNNTIEFGETVFDYDAALGTYTYRAGGYIGRFSLDSLEFNGGGDVPEPGTLALLGLGLAGLCLSGRCKTNCTTPSTPHQGFRNIRAAVLDVYSVHLQVAEETSS